MLEGPSFPVVVG